MNRITTSIFRRSYILIFCLFATFILFINHSFSQLVQSTSYKLSGTDPLYIFEGQYTPTLQGFSSTSADVITTITVSGVPAGYILRQVDYTSGDNSTNNSGNLSMTAKLRAPGSSTDKTLFDHTASFLTDASFKFTTQKFRIHTQLKTSSAQKVSAEVFANGYPFHGYIAPSQSWEQPTNVNGNWQFTSRYSGTLTNRKLNAVKLIFGPPFTYETITFNSGDNCSNAREIKTGKIYLSSNFNVQSNQTNYPLLTNWNGYRNSTAWFYFTAIQTTGRITISGFDQKKMQSVIVSTNSGNCSSSTGDYTIIQCERRGLLSNDGSPRSWSFEYNLTGLTVGKKYFLLVDGDGTSGAIGDQSNFYLEYESSLNSALPIELLSFSANLQNQYVDLIWKSASEKNNDYFTLLRSSDMIKWEAIGIVNGNGNSTHQIDYEFTDRSPLNGISYYKLKQTDYNGVSEEFSPVSVNMGSKGSQNSLSVYPNPASGNFTALVQAYNDSEGTIQIMDLTGNIAMSQKISIQKGANKFDFDSSQLERGIYVLHVVSEDGSKYAAKLVIE